MVFRLGLVLSVTIGLASTGSASLVNASFEDPPTGAGTWTNGSINGWSASSGAKGVFNIPEPVAFSIEAPDGDQIGYINGNYVAQVSTETLAIGTTKLSVMAGRRKDNQSASFELRLWVGGGVSGGIVIGSTLLESALFDVSQAAHDSFTLIFLSYDALPGDAHLGQDLIVQLARTSGTQMDFDDVRLTFVVPEPAGLLVCVSGVAFLAMKKRRSILVDQLARH